MLLHTYIRTYVRTYVPTDTNVLFIYKAMLCFCTYVRTYVPTDTNVLFIYKAMLCFAIFRNYLEKAHSTRHKLFDVTNANTIIFCNSKKNKLTTDTVY